MAQVEIKGLRKSYGKSEVLRGIDLTVKEGEVTAVLGPNASGKTTLLKCILGLVLPDAGSIRVGGVDIRESPHYRKMIGYMPQEPSFPENLTPEELLSLISEVRGQEPLPEKVEELVSLFRIERFIRKPIKTLSGGTKQKVSLLIALAYDPEVLIMDEPTAGLDPVSSSRLKELILRMKSSKAILLTSHIMSEVEELADRVVLLIEGNLKVDSSVEDLKTMTGEKSLEKALAKILEENLV